MARGGSRVHGRSHKTMQREAEPLHPPDSFVLARLPSWPAWPARELRGDERALVMATEPELQGMVIAEGQQLVRWFGWSEVECDEGGDNVGGRFAIVPSGQDYTRLDSNPHLFQIHSLYIWSGKKGWGSCKEWARRWVHGFSEAVQESRVDMDMET